MSINDSSATDENDNSIVVIADPTNPAHRVKVSPAGNLHATTTLQDGPNMDAFGRLRVSTPHSIFESTFQYNAQPLQWDSLTTGGGSLVHNPSTASVELRTGTDSGDSVIFQTRQYFKYHPGKSSFVAFSGKLASPMPNLRQRIGQFDANNGVFFEVDGINLNVVVRSKVSGAVVDTKAPQASWNMDRLDGTGPSGVALNPANQQILFFDYQWLGSGRIRVGTIIGGVTLYVHEIMHSNVISVPYSQTATLPFRGELTNTGTTLAPSFTRTTCATLYSEGSDSSDGFAKTLNSGTTYKAIAATGNIPILSIRKAAAMVRVPIKFSDIYVLSGAADDLLVTLTINPTLTGATFSVPVGAAEGDVTATAMTGGTEVYSFYLRATNSAGGTGAITADFFELANTVLGASISGVSDILTISVRSLTGTANAVATINFRELS